MSGMMRRDAIKNAAGRAFYVENDAYGDATVWKVNATGNGLDAPVLQERDVKDADLWNLICVAVTS